ncbi:MAG: (4Fe-4S)-binding protein [Jatrophihabitantaceae bacterium]
MTPTEGLPTAAGKPYPGEQVIVYYDGRRCRHFAECVRGLPEVFDVSARPWIRPDGAAAELVAEVVGRCPTGALHFQRADGTPERADPVTTVTALPGGPLLLRGQLRLVLTDEAGGAATVAETRMAACSCGRSRNTPFCDGACHPGH